MPQPTTKPSRAVEAKQNSSRHKSTSTADAGRANSGKASSKPLGPEAPRRFQDSHQSLSTRPQTTGKPIKTTGQPSGPVINTPQGAHKAEKNVVAGARGGPVSKADAGAPPSSKPLRGGPSGQTPGHDGTTTSGAASDKKQRFKRRYRGKKKGGPSVSSPEGLLGGAPKGPSRPAPLPVPPKATAPVALSSNWQALKQVWRGKGDLGVR